MEKLKSLISKTYRHFMRDSLYRNSVFLLINMGLSAFAGFIFWAICARLFSKEAIGSASAIISALGLAASVAGLGLNRTIVRFFFNSNSRKQDLSTKLFIIITMSFLVGLVGSAVLGYMNIAGFTIATIIIFTLATVMASLKGLLDSLFVSLKSASSMLIENSIFNLSKLILPFFVVSLGYNGIVSAHVLALIVAVAASFYLVTKKHGIKPNIKFKASTMKGKWHFALGSYSADLIGGLPNQLLPILVVAKFGPAAGAFWYTSMLIVNFLLMISSSINQAMFAEISSAKKMIGDYLKKAATAMYVIVIPLGVIIIIFSPSILGLFSKAYIEASPLLTILTIGAMVGLANYVTGSLLAFHKRVAYITIVNIVNALIVIGYTVLAAKDINDVAFGWLIGEIANILLFTAGALYIYKTKGLQHDQ